MIGMARKGTGMFSGHDVIVLDLEIARSPDEVATGWKNKAALGLSVGCYYDYLDNRIHWFDRRSLVQTVQGFVKRQPVMVSFNGISFDYALMRAVLRHDPVCIESLQDVPEIAQRVELLCQEFKQLGATSYDLLAEIYRADPPSRRIKGLNSLNALCAVNGLGAKTKSGEQAPKDWRRGRLASVLNYCQNDVYLTKALVEKVAEEQGRVKRNNGHVYVRYIRDTGEGVDFAPPAPLLPGAAT